LSDYLICSARETDWRFDPDDFERLLRERWPDAEITRFDDPDFLTALDFRVRLEDGTVVDGNLGRDGQIVGLDGDIPESAAVAAWVRSVVPAEQELIFMDQGYSFDIPLTDGIEPEQIVAAVPTD
jgi:YD repeat-containing protein